MAVHAAEPAARTPGIALPVWSRTVADSGAPSRRRAVGQRCRGRPTVQCIWPGSPGRGTDSTQERNRHAIKNDRSGCHPPRDGRSGHCDGGRRSGQHGRGCRGRRSGAAGLPARGDPAEGGLTGTGRAERREQQRSGQHGRGQRDRWRQHRRSERHQWRGERRGQQRRHHADQQPEPVGRVQLQRRLRRRRSGTGVDAVGEAPCRARRPTPTPIRARSTATSRSTPRAAT